MSIALQMIRGFFMGVADLVPGVSGGTMALVFGIYRDLITNVRTGAGGLGRLARGDVAGFVTALKHVNWPFLVPLLAGVGIAVLALSSVIQHFLETEAIAMSGLFFGLVISSMIVAWRLLTRQDLIRVAIIGAVGVIMFFVLGLRSGPVDDPSLILFVGAGAVAICAMILPGVSGAFLLLMLGMYGPVLDAVNDRQIGVLALFLVGAVLGLSLFSSALNWALERHYDTVMAALIGLMLGSLRVLWPWPDGVGIPETHNDAGDIINAGTSGTALGAPSGDVVLPVILAIVAAAAVLIVSHLAERRSAAAQTAAVPG